MSPSSRPIAAKPSLRARTWPCLITAMVMLGGCASFSPERGLGPVEQTTHERLGKSLVRADTDADLDTIAQRVSDLLSEPLTVDNAVQLALLNNRGLQASFQALGITEAEVVQAGRIPNPGLSFGRSSRGEEREIERGLHLNLSRVLLMPLIQRMEARRFEQAQVHAAAQVLKLAADTRKAYFVALAAEESVRYRQQVKAAADASAELAQRMQQVGNFNALQRAREQSFSADATLKLTQAQQLQRATRERLIRLLGLWGPQTQFMLPPRLPDLPPAPTEWADIEQLALAQRLDVQAAKHAVAQTAHNLGLTRTTRFINVLELGVMHNTSNEAPPQRQWEVGFELPLFDWGGARVAKAQAIYMQALHQAAQTAIEARSEVREAYSGYRSAYELALYHRDEMVPLSQRIAQENLLRYNGMLIGVFELLADARTQIATVNAAIEALRDFWLAQSDLDRALLGKPELSAPISPSAAASPTEAAGH